MQQIRITGVAVEGPEPGIGVGVEARSSAAHSVVAVWKPLQDLLRDTGGRYSGGLSAAMACASRSNRVENTAAET